MNAAEKRACPCSPRTALGHHFTELLPRRHAAGRRAQFRRTASSVRRNSISAFRSSSRAARYSSDSFGHLTDPILSEIDASCAHRRLDAHRRSTCRQPPHRAANPSASGRSPAGLPLRSRHSSQRSSSCWPPVAWTRELAAGGLRGVWGIVLATLFLVVAWFGKVVIAGIVFLIDPPGSTVLLKCIGLSRRSATSSLSLCSPCSRRDRTRMRTNAPADTDAEPTPAQGGALGWSISQATGPGGACFFAGTAICCQLTILPLTIPKRAAASVPGASQRDAPRLPSRKTTVA